MCFIKNNNTMYKSDSISIVTEQIDNMPITCVVQVYLEDTESEKNRNIIISVRGDRARLEISEYVSKIICRLQSSDMFENKMSFNLIGNNGKHALSWVNYSFEFHKGFFNIVESNGDVNRPDYKTYYEDYEDYKDDNYNYDEDDDDDENLNYVYDNGFETMNEKSDEKSNEKSNRYRDQITSQTESDIKVISCLMTEKVRSDLALSLMKLISVDWNIRKFQREIIDFSDVCVIL